MSAFPITFVISACLLAIFIIYFARSYSGQRKRGIDHESLLPLEEETPKVVTKTGSVQRAEDGAKSEAKDGEPAEGSKLGESSKRPEDPKSAEDPKRTEGTKPES